MTITAIKILLNPPSPPPELSFKALNVQYSRSTVPLPAAAFCFAFAFNETGF